MPPLHYVLIALFLISAIGNVLLVGQPREPKTAENAAMEVLLNAVLIAALVAFR